MNDYVNIPSFITGVVGFILTIVAEVFGTVDKAMSIISWGLGTIMLVISICIGIYSMRLKQLEYRKKLRERQQEEKRSENKA